MANDPLQLQAGDLRHSITITAASSTVDEYGQPTASWGTVLVTRAKIESTTSLAYKELIQSGIISSDATDVVTLRWPGTAIDVQAGMRVLFEDNTYLVQAVDNVLRRNRVVKLFCQAIDADSN